MNTNIAQAVADLRRTSNLPVDPAKRGPVPLQKFFQAADCDVSHVAIPKLCLKSVVEYLVAERWVNDPDSLADLAASTEHLDGFLFWSAAAGVAFVDADAILPRRRFTAAHELGHAVLHRGRMGRYRPDAAINEGADDSNDELEREANRFAAELLMPEAVIQERAAELVGEFGACPRVVLASRLASELLVSREAMRYRLKGLGVGHD